MRLIALAAMLLAGCATGGSEVRDYRACLQQTRAQTVEAFGACRKAVWPSHAAKDARPAKKAPPAGV